ncbi:MAG: N-6 DNA methylase [Metallibacterium scheffleri]|jgi:SAM-dependent methyltransferase|uniref:N-6 DNA methylase n=1 Tax=Metallibacterium scheffleri TaxID=993689 RepID=UPI0026F02530|nr:N-6 DNA methylase [Metallibacterium scheffleri]MCK9366567.1 N-6 DNA methylase [Metallibacterium scheffleri]
MNQLVQFPKSRTAQFANEPEVSAFSDWWLRSLGYALKHNRTGDAAIDKAWPSKTAKARGTGVPDLLVYLPNGASGLICVWENKAPSIDVDVALQEAKGYVDGLHRMRPSTPGLPRIAAGFNGKALRLAYLTFGREWVDVKAGGEVVTDAFPRPDYIANGLSSTGNFQGVSGTITRNQLRAALPRLKTLYRGIPILASGRKPIDFTVALLTLKMLVESTRAWGTWAEQPGLVSDAANVDQAIAERFIQLARRVMADTSLYAKYGDIFEFREEGREEPLSFNFLETLENIVRGKRNFERLFLILDDLAPLHGSDFDLFGEVYQAIGDDATKRALGEFFTGRHIIAAVVPILFERAGAQTIKEFRRASIADVACGTGGFLTETLRYVRRQFDLNEAATRQFAQHAFYGYDLSAANASRARVNMYFAGDGFSEVKGNFDALAKKTPDIGPFDYILTNPPYGAGQNGRLEEAFLARVIGRLKPGGWGLIVLPTGVLENPRSESARLNLLRETVLTDVISLPMHAFAPYTKQRTAILIFRRRPKPLVGAAWPDLLARVAHEKVSFFIVDNDGFANSDKRYETDRHNADGSWQHDDLTAWSDSKGRLHPGKLFAALVQQKSPTAGTDEFGTPLGPKYAVMSLGAMSKAKPGELVLLPDSYLRPMFGTVSLPDFDGQAQALISEANGRAGPGTILERTRALLATRVAVPASGIRGKKKPRTRVDEIFAISKGTTGLTEAVIYKQFDPEGLPVYGGGETPPRFTIANGARSKNDDDITIHSAPALIVSLDGSSGAVRVVKKGKFVLNHHGCVLKPLPGKNINLHYAAQQLEGGLRALAANRGASATLTLPKLKSFVFPYPAPPAIVTKLKRLRIALEAIRDRYG